jgi:hypothetical protein
LLPASRLGVNEAYRRLKTWSKLAWHNDGLDCREILNAPIATSDTVGVVPALDTLTASATIYKVLPSLAAEGKGSKLPQRSVVERDRQCGRCKAPYCDVDIVARNRHTEEDTASVFIGRIGPDLQVFDIDAEAIGDDRKAIPVRRR